ncbi:MAG: ABC transporter permease [Nitratireductor sp.]|nr:ABC transporter permease [Nitratireductor sp.]MCC0021974.1 ABC transporter permease [Nitratireductor sp.]
MKHELPKWVDYGLIPLLNLITAFLVAGLVVLLVGENPVKAAYLLVRGAFGYGGGIGYTLFYATNFIFTGLSVAVAIHCGLFNIGSEGQAYVGGIGVAAACLALDRYVPWYVTFPFAVLGAAAMGAAWAFIPAWLQARRGSHVVITTIMFNFIASALMIYLLVEVFKPAGSMAPETRTFEAGGQIPKLDWLFNLFGSSLGGAPFNWSFFLALACCYLVWLLIWRTRLGYEIRTTGINPTAAVYAGIPPVRTVVIAMLISGALAGMMAINPVMGDQARLQESFPAGAGFVGIAVSLMGRNHPVGIILAAILFGMLWQGGAELAFDMPKISRDMIVVIQGLVILFAGALEHMYRPALSRAFARRQVLSADQAAREGV